MKVVCEKYNLCALDCIHKTPNDWDGVSYLIKNYCYRIDDNVNFLKMKDVRKKKLEKLNNENNL